jgi:hypothetical protein
MFDNICHFNLIVDSNLKNFIFNFSWEFSDLFKQLYLRFINI